MDPLRTPGVLLLREEGLPTVQAGYYDNLVPLDERAEYLAEHLIIYFLNDWLGGNVFQSLGGSLLASTGPSGDGAVAVDAILRDLAYRSPNPWGPVDSSVWFTAHDFDTEAYFGTAVWEMVTGTTSGHFGNMVWRTRQRPGTWDLAQRTSLAAITGWPDPYRSFALVDGACTTTCPSDTFRRLGRAMKHAPCFPPWAQWKWRCSSFGTARASRQLRNPTRCGPWRSADPLTKRGGTRSASSGCPTVWSASRSRIEPTVG